MIHWCLLQSKPWPLMSVSFFQVYGLLDNLVIDMMVLAESNTEKPGFSVVLWVLGQGRRDLAGRMKQVSL